MDSDRPLPHDDRRPAPRTVDEVHDALRNAILRGDLQAGEIMSQVRLAREFNVGRTPLREALRMLQREGLIEGEYNRRMRVAPFLLSDLEQVYALRIPIEALGVRISVPSLTEKDLDELENDVVEIDRSSRAQDFESWERAVRHLHCGLGAYAGDRICAQVEMLFDHTQRYRHLFVRSDPVAWGMGAPYDQRIVQACRRRDAIAASEQLAILLGRAAFAGIASVAPGHDPAIVRSALRMVIGTSSALPGPFAPIPNGTLGEPAK